MTSEKQTAQSKESTEASNGNAGGDQYTTSSLIANANSAAERMEAAVKAQKAENDRREELLARERLGGRSQGAQPEVKKELSDKEYAQLALQNKLPVK